MGAAHASLGEPLSLPLAAGSAPCSCLPSGRAREHCGAAWNVEEIAVAPRVDRISWVGGAADDLGGGCGGRLAVGGPLVPFLRYRAFFPHTRKRFHDHYTVERLIGEGSYGNVYGAVARSPSLESSAALRGPRRVAVKCFRLSPPVAGRPENEGEALCQDPEVQRASFETERLLLAHAEHPHIVKMFECFVERDLCWIVMELCPGGEVYDWVAERASLGAGVGLQESEASRFFRQMVQAVSYLHSLQIVHRDVKTENFLLLGPPGSREHGIVKLCDFGTAVQLTPAQPRALERIGTLSYTAPEIYQKLGATTAADIWSLGVVLYVMLLGASPFRTTGQESAQATVDRIVQGGFDTSRPAWAALSSTAQELVCQLLVVDENRRPVGVGILRHAFLRSEHRLLSVALTSVPGSTLLSSLAPFAPRVLELAHEFAGLDLLQQVALCLCVRMTPEVEILGLLPRIPWYELFLALDARGEGHIDPLSFATGMRALLGPSHPSDEQDLRALAEALDLDGSGAIEWSEWSVLALVAHEGRSLGLEALFTAFRALDRPSHDGVLGVGDMLEVLSGASGGAEPGISVRAREVACRALSRWASRSARSGLPGRLAAPPKPFVLKSSREATLSSPAVAFADLQRALCAVSQGSDDGDCLERQDSETSDTTATNCTGQSATTDDVSGLSLAASWLACCEADGNPPHFLLVQPETVFMPHEDRVDVVDSDGAM